MQHGLNKNCKRCIILALAAASLLMLFFSYLLYRDNSTVPEMLSQITSFFSNYILIMVGLDIILILDGFDVAKEKSRKYYIGLFLILFSIVTSVILVSIRIYNIDQCYSGASSASFEYGGWQQDMLIPTALSILSSIGLGLVSNAACNLQNKRKSKKKHTS